MYCQNSPFKTICHTISDDVQGLDDSINVSSAVDIGTTLYNLTTKPVSQVPGRKKRGRPHTSDEFDIILNTTSPYYEMIFGKLLHLFSKYACFINVVFFQMDNI